MKKMISLMAISLFLFAGGKEMYSNHTLDSNGIAYKDLSGFAADFMNFYDRNTQSQIILQKYSQDGIPIDNMAKLDATISDEANNSIVGTLEINGIGFAFNNAINGYTGGSSPSVVCFNQTNSIVFTTSYGDELLNTELIVPKEVVIHTQPNNIAPLQSIGYNADISNGAGLLCMVIFDNRDPYNIDYAENEAITNLSHVENDDGLYSLPESLFTDIPEGAMLKIVLIRGVVQYVEKEDNNFGVVAYSNSSIQAVYQR